MKASGRMGAAVVLLILLMGMSGFTYAEEIKVGSVHPFTGPRALPGIEAHNGTEIAVDMQNSLGGILGGRQVRIVKGDAKDPEAAASETERLISTEGIKIIFGTYSSSVGAPAHQVAGRRGVLYFENVATEDTLTRRGNKFLLRFDNKGSQLGEMIADYSANFLAPMYKKKPSELKMVVFRLNDAWGTAIGGTAIKKSKEAKINVVGDFPYDLSVIDFKSLLLKAKSLEPDIVVFVSYATDGINLMNGARAIGLKPKVIIGSGVWAGLVETGKSMGDDANYILSIESGFGVNPNYMTEKAKKTTAEFEKRYKKKFGVDAPSNAYVAFWSAWVALHEILTKTNELDTQKIRQIASEISLSDRETNTGMGVKYAPVDSPDAGHNLRSTPLVRQRFNDKLYVVYPLKFAVIRGQPDPGWGNKKVSSGQIKKWLGEVK